MGLPKISIVTPSYNQARYIEWTLRTVILQRYPRLEFVVIDGGSQDGTTEILKKYDQHLLYWQSTTDRGQSDAIHQGFKHTSGEIMGYLNSDDMLAPGTLHWIAQFFPRHPHVDAVYSHRCAVDEANRVIWYWLLPRHSNYLMKRWDLIPQETCFWRRRIYEEVGGIDPKFQFAMDYDLFVRFMHRGTMFRANRFLGAFRQHPAAKTSTQMQGVGSREVQQILVEYGIRTHRWDQILALAFKRFVELRSHLFTQSRQRLPGSLPGLGYNYCELWGGLLSDPRVPPK